jgi:hypothetical protein
MGMKVTVTVKNSASDYLKIAIKQLIEIKASDPSIGVSVSEQDQGTIYILDVPNYYNEQAFRFDRDYPGNHVEVEITPTTY